MEPEMRSVQPATEPLRARKRAATRRSLEEAAVRLFAEKGFARTTIDDIAAGADASRSTFFRYFRSKESVLFGPDDETGERFVELIGQRPLEEGPMRAFEAALEALAAETPPRISRESARDRREVVMSDPHLRVRRAENLARWTQRLAQALADREGGPIAPAHRLAAWVGIAVAQEMGDQWTAPGEEKDPADLVRDRFALLRSLLTE